MIRLSLVSANTAFKRYPGFSLMRLVTARLDLDEIETQHLSDIFGIDPRRSEPNVAKLFDEHLRKSISRYDLHSLFTDDCKALYHHAIRPAGYDFYRGEVDPEGMREWRACYRGMSGARQMLAASIVWLYRAGKDKVWLRRVPCTWQAAEAIACMQTAGVLTDWARLYLLYPGW
ncbi:hypothetical protein B0E33_18745 [Roseibium algicola]|uniref:Uncharacterized protein n=1 Tax=Roseibium algicola TaxID=2857014 RepID=A0ABN4X125_9HYPH|nr:hypothetical protein B0E33_18745 [Roseibium aggregatum]